MRCYRCEATLKPNTHKCGSCGVWTWEEHVNVKKERVYWEDISEKPLVRMSLGILDECLCGGVVKSDVVLIGGEPGAGKSTLLLKTCEKIYEHGTCVYIASEEDIPTIKARGKRLGLEPPKGKLVFVNAMGGGADIAMELVDVMPAGFIIDSLNGLVGGDLNQEIRALHIIKKLCVQLQAPAIIISQVNADLDFSGLMAKQHEVDVLLRLTKDHDHKSENGEPIRILESTDKNRNGRVGIETILEMTEHGLVPIASGGDD